MGEGPGPKGEHKIFREIPWLPKEEETRDLPTARESPFRNAEVIRIADMIAGFRSAKKEDRTAQRRKISLYSLDQERYALFQKILHDNIDVEKERDSPDAEERIAIYRDILGAVEQPLEFFGLNMFFFTHVILRGADAEPVRNRLVDSIRKPFKKDERNVVLLEAGTMPKDYIKTFRAGLKAYGSYRKAAAYQSLLHRLGQMPNKIEVENEVSRMTAFFDNLRARTQISPPSQAPYSLWLMYEAFDQILAEGYKFDLIYEKNIEPNVTISQGSLDDFKRQTPELTKQIQRRNARMLNQILELAREAENKMEKTNVFSVMGIAHRIIRQTLSPKLEASSESVLVDEINFPVNLRVFVELLDKVAKDPGSISDLDWNEAYKMYFNPPQR